jgi:hypothetical protein
MTGWTADELEKIETAEAALARLDKVQAEPWATPQAVQRLRNRYTYQRRRFGARVGAVPDDGVEEHS